MDANGHAKRSHVELRINDAEAEVVRTIFRLYCRGHGFTTIAKTPERRRAPCPRPRPAGGKPLGWASSSVRESCCAGSIVANRSGARTKKRDQWGEKPHRRPSRTG